MKVEWVQTGHVRAVSRDHTVYRAVGYPIQKEIIVPKRGMACGRPKVLYYIDDDPREFRTEQAMLCVFEIDFKKDQDECGTA